VTGRLAAVLAASLLALPAAAATVTVELGGGVVIPWSAPAEVGNALGAGVHLELGVLSAGFVGAAVMPESRTQGQFGAFWLEARAYPWGRRAVLAPFAAVGLGVATPDGFEDRGLGIDPARWVVGGPSFLALLGLGLRYGAPRGLQVALDLRAYNHTHGGVNLLASLTF